jgi:hypothetical protein
MGQARLECGRTSAVLAPGERSGIDGRVDPTPAILHVNTCRNCPSTPWGVPGGDFSLQEKSFDDVNSSLGWPALLERASN